MSDSNLSLALISLDELSRRLGAGKALAVSTLYGVLHRVEVATGEAIGLKPGRRRVFTEADFNLIVETLKC